ncbi:MAG: glucose-1-phosphate cytidylyltransferase [Paracoccaceae bacterium]
MGHVFADIPVVVLAGGLGTRLSEETGKKPKPMVEIGDIPMLVHIIRYYRSFGCKEFIVALGYMGDYIKSYFEDYLRRSGSQTIDFTRGEIAPIYDHRGEDWTLHLLETGHDTMTGGRIKRCAEFVGQRKFFATYGDGLSNIDLNALLDVHNASGGLATLSAVRPPSRFGRIEFDGNQVVKFDEKPQLGEGWINGGFFALEPGVADYIADDAMRFEHEPMQRLAADGQLAAHFHKDFWQCMDTLRDVKLLREIWDSGNPPWRPSSRKGANGV